MKTDPKNNVQPPEADKTPLEKNLITKALSQVPANRVKLFSLLLLTTLVFAIRLTAPPDIMDNDQERPASYILDILRNGHWIVQTDWMDDITSKPPMYTWISALLSLPLGSLNAFTLYLPCGIATFLLVFMIFKAGSRYAGATAGFAAGLLYLTNHLVTKQIALARTDPLFSLFVALGAWLAFNNWIKRKNWTLFWLIAAAATLTKGPFGIILAASGLSAAIWERISKAPSRIRGKQWPGIILFLLITGGWFMLACNSMGQPVFDKMIGKELLSLAVGSSHGDPLYFRIWIPTFYFITRFFPASIFTIVGAVHIIRKPSPNEYLRKLERFMLCWFLLGIAILSVAQHQRGDLLMPLLPPAAVIAGRMFAAIGRKDMKKFRNAAVLLIVIYFAVLGWHEYYFKPYEMKEVRRTAGMRQTAEFIRSNLPDNANIYYVDAPYAIQYYLNTMSHDITFEKAAGILKETDPVWVAVKRRDLLTKHLVDSESIHIVKSWPDNAEPYVSIFSNYPLTEEK